LGQGGFEQPFFLLEKSLGKKVRFPQQPFLLTQKSLGKKFVPAGTTAFCAAAQKPGEKANPQNRD